MKLIADMKTGKLIVNDKTFSISNDVRTVQNGARRMHEVVRSIPDNFPYMPAKFPGGLWNITGLEWQAEKKFDFKTYGPVKIRTDAWQYVKIWDIDEDGDYLRETEQNTKDFGYLLHYSESKTTLGCIRIGTAEEAVALGMRLEAALKNKEAITLEVI
jgi:hypothetical protein